MANFSNFRRTTAGLDMLTKVESQGEILDFTRFKLGDGIWTFPDDVAAMTDLVSPLKIQPVGQVRRIDQTRYSVVATITAADLPATGFHITEVGLYAQTDQSAEVLYGVVHAEIGQTDYLPGCSEGIDQAYTISIEITASAEANITLVVDNSGLLARQEMAEHEALLINETTTGNTPKHLTDSQAKKWEDHTKDPHSYLPINGLASGSILATIEEAEAGARNDKLLTPKTGKAQVIEMLSNKPPPETFTVSGEYTAPDNVFMIHVEVRGTGGNGGINDRSAGSQSGTTSFGGTLLQATGGYGGAEFSGGAGGQGSCAASVVFPTTTEGEAGTAAKGGGDGGGPSATSNKTHGQDGTNGGGGGGGAYNTGDRGDGGGEGGYAAGYVRVSPGQVFQIVIGAVGTMPNYSGYHGGYGGTGYVKISPFI